MTWRDRFQEGSFRGVPFFVSESRATFGRRNAIHQYPGRDQPWAEDLGRAADRWTIECFVVGDDYDLARDALIAAIRASGSGTLIHPYLGTKTASVDNGAEVTDSTEEGGMARFSIPFVEAGADTTPAATPDTQGAAVAAAANVGTAAATSATTRLSVANVAGFVNVSAQGLVGSVGAAISGALGLVRADPLQAFSFLQSLATFSSAPQTLLADPGTLAATIFSTVGAVGTLATYADDALTQLVGPTGVATGQQNGLIGFGSDLPAIAPTTPDRVTQAANQAALCQILNAAAAASAVSVIADMAFTSYDDAVSIRDPVADQLDQLATTIADSGDDNLAGAVDALRLAMITDVTARGASLARLYAYTPPNTQPAILIAQRLYGDATRADELIARNAIPHPSFVPGGQTLEVLSNA
jgi:prophage DNA circulation protein